MVDGVELTVHVAEPLRDLSAALHELTLSFALLVPLALLLTAFSGYWVSRAALAPVEQIRRQADAIDPADLTARLHVPCNDDELGRLALTLNAMLARIERGFRSVEQFTADASHELRGSLAFVITAGDVSLRRTRTQEELTESIGKIVVEARRMSKLVEDLLALARGDAQRGAANHEPISLSMILEEVTDRLSQVGAAKGLLLTIADSTQPIQVIGNDSELCRLFMILLDNAIKYTDQGVVSITVSLEPPWASVVVRDSGIGIDPDALPRIFDRFWRADKVRSRAEGGAGLGLSLAAQIVQRHGGTIFVESSLGGGSSVNVRLPLSDLYGKRHPSENLQVHR